LVDYKQLGYSDEATLRKYITNHYNYTKSERAKEILEDWDNAMLKFIKVFPKEYKEALKKQKKTEEKVEESKESKVLV
jgi:glutamate synthase (NADPH/NADH) large chain